jgi:hypothetical protein
MGDKDPGHSADQGRLKVFGEPSAPTEPGESALDDPAAWPADLIGALRTAVREGGCPRNSAPRCDQETTGEWPSEPRFRLMASHGGLEAFCVPKASSLLQAAFRRVSLNVSGH